MALDFADNYGSYDAPVPGPIDPSRLTTHGSHRVLRLAT